ncbi:MAG: hypothetical protein HUJ22_10120 [Gracilimonas sp.]|uniref:hypothetical protein n=1 Tax=Gracilimonas sp. TaxID=1974203 RepID=UPI0019B682C7|nr:hypothetical protein [Gracilimonas sp.]MBD3616916.1 hypothetical protein [Gracilimonas sp.]
MKTLLLLLFMLSGVLGTVQAQTCYYYVSQHADSDFEVYKGEELKIIYSNIVSADCDENETAIGNEYHDALKAKYPKTYFHTTSHIVWGPFDTRGEAGRKKRKQMGDDRADDFKTIDFYFTYYGD